MAGMQLDLSSECFVSLVSEVIPNVGSYNSLGVASRGNSSEGYTGKSSGRTDAYSGTFTPNTSSCGPEEFLSHNTWLASPGRDNSFVHAPSWHDTSAISGSTARRALSCRF